MKSVIVWRVNDFAALIFSVSPYSLVSDLILKVQIILCHSVSDFFLNDLKYFCILVFSTAIIFQAICYSVDKSMVKSWLGFSLEMS